MGSRATATLRGSLVTLDGVVLERITRCITACAFSGPQCEAITSNRGLGPGMQGGADHGEVDLCRLIVAVAVVWMVVWILAMPSSAALFTAAVVCFCLWGNPE